MSKYGVFFGPYFPVFGLNTEITEQKYGAEKLRIRTLLTQREPTFMISLCTSFVSVTELRESSVTLNSQVNVRNLYISQKERDLLIVHVDVHKIKKKARPKSNAQALAKLAKMLYPLLFPPLCSLWTSETNDLYKLHIKKILPKKTINIMQN